MRDFQRKQKIRKTLYSRGVLLGVFLLILLVSKATWGLYDKEQESRKSLDRVEADLSALVLREEQLQGDITRLRTPEGIESEIREQFQVARPGESMVVLVEDAEVSTEHPVAEKSLVSKFFDLFR